MKSLYRMVLAILICVASGYAQAPDTLWTRTYGGVGSDIGVSVLEIVGGGYLIAGCGQSFGGYYDIFVMQLDENGDSIWFRTYGGDGYEGGGWLISTSDNNYILVGATTSYGGGQPNTSNVYIVKINGEGDTLWTRAYGGEYHDAGGAIIEERRSDTQYPDIITVGSTFPSMPGNTDAFLLKINARGDSLCAWNYGGTQSEFLYSVQCVEDGYVCAGYTDSYGAGGHDAYLVKVDRNGVLQWGRTYGGVGYDEVYSMQCTPDGGFITAGYTDSFGPGVSAVYVLRVDSLGDTLWTGTFGGFGHEDGSYIARTRGNCYVITGSTRAFGASTGDVYLLKIDSLGNILWSGAYGDASDELGCMVLETSDHGYIIAGQKRVNNTEDIYIIKTAPDTLMGLEQVEGAQALTALIAKPNPCRGVINIEYSLAVDGFVEIAVYDVLGMQRTQTVREFKSGGRHRDDIDLTPLPDGVYFIRLSTPVAVMTERIVCCR